jgi:S1-C subfamily serine protease
MKLLVHALTIVVAMFCTASTRAALFPPYFLSAVVSLGTTQIVQEQGKEPVTKWITVGTGFFYGYLVHDDADIAKRKYAVFLVTAGHVIKGFAEAGNSKIEVRVDANEVGAKAESFDIPISQWFFHPAVDLAAVPTSIDFLRSKGLQNSFFASDLHVLTKKQMTDAGTSAGDGVFILGFPMGLSGERRNYVIVRQGAIARISELFEDASNIFLVDAFVFPGNSGGPVVSKPEITSIQGTQANSRSLLVGVVKSYESYVDTAVSQQTKHARITFEENSGLAEIIPVDYINEMVKQRAEAVWDATQQRAAPAPLTIPNLPIPQSPLLPLPQNPLLQLPK